MTENEDKSWLDVLKGISIPDWVTDNLIAALGKGILNSVTGILTTASEIPKAALQNRSEKIKLIGEVQRELIRKAAEHSLLQVQEDSELAERALKYHGVKLLEQQVNRESIAQKTLENLRHVEFLEDEPENKINRDWLTAFWNMAENKSEEDVQNLLARILNNEIVKPGSLSLHTLQVLSILDSEVGKSFAKLCNMSIDDGDLAFFIHPNVFPFQNIGKTKMYGFNFHELLALDGAGLIRSAETIRLQFKEPFSPDAEPEYEEVEYLGGKAKLATAGEQLNFIYFTQAGTELRRLMELKEVPNYTLRLKEILKDKFIVES